ncbi:hypothetical protein [Sphingomonas sp.]|uniref:hypothetical protein n=1 Tax=Sphingomonas sp. TaxID=28214 RepID=UPI0031E3D912
MAYDFSNAGRVESEGSGAGRFLTFEAVEARLVDAVRLCWRMPGGHWPFASDGPWHLIQKDWWDWDARDEKPIPRDPLSRLEMEERDEAVAWLRLIPDDRDRRLVVLAVTQLAKGGDRARVSWVKLLRPIGKTHGADGLRMRYGRVLGALTVRINAVRG